MSKWEYIWYLIKIFLNHFKSQLILIFSKKLTKWKLKSKPEKKLGRKKGIMFKKSTNCLQTLDINE